MMIPTKPLRIHFVILLAAISLAGAVGCTKQKECVDQSQKPLEECKINSDKLQAEIVTLKRQLAQALANPGTIQVDPEVLAIDGKKPIKVKPREGTLSQEQVISTMRANKAVLKRCYEKAMKKNSKLQQQQITLTIAFKVFPSGSAKEISIRPVYDFPMSDCMKTAIKRWRFPAFTGQPVGVESPLRLSPKN